MSGADEVGARTGTLPCVAQADTSTIRKSRSVTAAAVSHEPFWDAMVDVIDCIHWYICSSGDAGWGAPRASFAGVDELEQRANARRTDVIVEPFADPGCEVKPRPQLADPAHPGFGR